MSANSSALPSSPSSPRRRSRFILSKFRSRLGPRNRNISDFYIEPDDPWRSYSPGDVLEGTVIVTVVRPVRITHLVLCLHGFVKVFKNTTASLEAPVDLGFLGTGRGRRGSEYLGNGLAMLFEDEIVLCGEGRLREGIYKFRFEIGFPPYALPTSITFERGTISYMLTSTLTRPTKMNPILTCRKRINLLENIDIASIPAPKARIVTLEPVSKRSKSKGKGKLSGSEPVMEALSRDHSMPGAANGENRPPLSAASSDFSSSSRLSNSSQSFQVAIDRTSSNSISGPNSGARSITASVSDKTITAKIEVPRAGALPGDTLPIIITVNHCKLVRSPHSIIVTLYRQGRIDLHPAIPVGVAADGKQPVFEDSYPRTRTGLGGLNFGTSRTSCVFRKDLSQSFAPLIVDPTSMCAYVKTSVRFPEDAFPTITRVPGSMINFRYYVEVVIDLRGKLGATDRFLPRLNMVSSGSTFSPNGQVLNTADNAAHSVTTNWEGHILETDQIRRSKGVIAVPFEIVVGVRDSLRRKGHTESHSTAEDGFRPSHMLSREDSGLFPDPSDPRNDWQTDPQNQHVHFPDSHLGVRDFDDYGHGGEDLYTADDYPADDPDAYPECSSAEHPRYFEPTTIGVPPPPEEPHDEKARLRRVEQMLLPSQPPDEDPAGPSSAAPGDTTPSAPLFPDDGPVYDYHHVGSPLYGDPAAPSVSVAASFDPAIPGQSAPGPPEPLATQAYHHLQSLTAPPGDDKQEMERHRLLLEASAPELDARSGPRRAGVLDIDAPNAPVFDDEDDHIAGAVARADETLPRYQQ